MRDFTDSEQKTISEMLERWGQLMIGRTPLQPGTDHIDVKALHEMEETQVLIDFLKKSGVESSSHLMDMGFVAAGMLLRFKK